MSFPLWSKLRPTKPQRKSERRESRKYESRDRIQRKLRIDPLEQRQLMAVTPVGGEFLINPAATAAAFQQRLAANLPVTQAQNNYSIGVDHDGDFAVAWTSYNDQDGDGAAVFMRVFDRFGIAITGEIQVNQFTEGDQRNAAIAMDADGDFAIVWESQGQDLYDGSSGIYARRYSAAGVALGDEYQVNTVAVNDQRDPTIAMDDVGNYIIAWEAAAQNQSFFNDVKAQMFSRDGVFVGSEFRVNITNVPGSHDLNVTAAMDPDGDFVLIWQVPVLGLFARIYDPTVEPPVPPLTRNPFPEFPGQFGAGGPIPPEFVHLAEPIPQIQPVARTGEIVIPINDNTFRSTGCHSDKPDAMWFDGLTGEGVRNAKVIMDSKGNWTVTWEMLKDNDIDPDVDGDPCDNGGGADDVPESWGVYMRQFDVAGNPRTANDISVNPVYTNDFDPTVDIPDPGFLFADDQGSPAVAVDADGDMAFVYDGNGAESLGGTNADDVGVWLKLFQAGGFELQTNPFRVNTTSTGAQRHPSVGMEPDGDFVVVWSGNGFGDTAGVFARRYNESTDTAGPLVTDWLINGGRVARDDVFIQTVNSIVVRFDEQLNDTGKTGISSVENVSNWSILRDGVEITGGITNIEFAFNASSHKWEAVLSLDGNGIQPGVVPLGDGEYQLITRNTIRDVAGNPLGAAGFNLPNQGLFRPDGVSLMQRFNVRSLQSPDVIVNTTTSGNQEGFPESRQMVAKDADGNFVAVWTSPDSSGKGVFAQRFRANGAPDGFEFQVNALTAGDQQNPSVAIDADGDFVVTWSSRNPSTGDWDVYARRFDAQGVARITNDALGDVEFLVNTHTENIQRFSTIAMDVDGDFVISWQSYDQDESGYGVYAQRYSPDGSRLGGVNEVQTIEFTGNPVGGSFELTFNGTTVGPIAFSTRRAETANAIEAALAPIADVDVTSISDTEFLVAFVGGDAGRDVEELVATPLSAGFEIDVETTTEGVSSEFQVAETTLGNQLFPVAAMDALGHFVITWTSAGQAGDTAFETNVFARRYDNNAAGGAALSGEFLVNTNGILNNQRHSHVSMDLDGDFVITWTSYGHDNNGSGYGGGSFSENGIFAQRYSAAGAALGSEFQVNNFTEGDQQYSAVALDADGDFTIVWQSEAQDGSGDGIFARSFRNNGAPTSNEFAVNASTAGNQRFPSISTDAEGEVIIVWSGTGAGDASGSGIFSRSFPRTEDDAGPIVADVLYEAQPLSLAQLAEGITLNTPLSRVVVSFSEELDDLRAQNVRNWSISRNANAIQDGIVSVQFGLNQAFASGLTSVPSGKWEAVVTFDANPVLAGLQSLDAGQYTLTVTDTIEDVAENALDGDFDGTPGGDFTRSFSILIGSPEEFQVNTTTSGQQTTQIESPRAVAVDSDGDFIAVWTSYGQDGAASEGVFAQRFRSNGTRVGAEFRVNTTTVGDQRNATIAIDADGDFVVTWTSYTAGGDPNIFARRYSAAGVATGDEFQVNTNNTGVQKWSTAAIDVDGDLVITYTGEDGAGYGIFARRYNSAGATLGPEFQVNSTTAGNQLLASVAIDADGDFVVTWTSEGQDGSGDGVFGRLFDAAGNALGAEFQVNTFTLGNQSYATVDRDQSGDFVVTWSSDGQDGSGYGVYFQRYNAAGVRQGVETQVNISTNLNQQFPSVALDADGDFTITWSGFGDVAGQDDDVGVFARRFNANGTPKAPPAGIPGTGEFLVNTTRSGMQRISSIGSSAAGDIVIVWSGAGDGDSDGIFSRLFDEPTDNAGPLVSDVLFGTTQVLNGSSLPTTVTQMTIAFDEDMSQEGGASGANSVLNRGNWQLTRNGVQIVDGIKNITFGFDIDKNKYLAVLTFDGNGLASGTPPLPTGTYVLTARQAIRDISGNALDGNQDGIPGVDFTRTFTVVTATTGPSTEFGVNTTKTGVQTTSPETPQAVASDADGDYVIVWSSPDQTGAVTSDGIFGQRFNSLGQPQGPEFQINTSVEFNQRHAAVARDADGDFVVTWTSYTSTGDSNIFARRYNALGTALSPEIQVNSTIFNPQKWSTVAVDVQGDFVIAWTSFGIDGSGYGVYAQRFSSAGNAVGPEFRVNTTIVGNQQFAQAAMDATGDFVITWTGPDVSGDGIFGQRYAANGVAAGTEFLVNTTTVGDQRYSRVAMDLSGNFVITWTSPDISGNGVFFRRYNAAGVAQGLETQANVTTTGDQHFSAIALDHTGDFIITWAGNGTVLSGNSDTNGIFARRFNAAGVGILPPPAITGTANEFLVNTTTVGAQRSPSITIDGDGDFVVAWNGNGASAAVPPNAQDTDDQGIFGRQFEQPTDNTGPIVADVIFAGTTQVTDGAALPNTVAQLVVTFGEELTLQGDTGGANSASNPNNWVLSRNGSEILGAITAVSFAANPLSGKLEAVLSLDGNGISSGVPPLPEGNYVLTVRSFLQDTTGNGLDGNYDGVIGVDFTRRFSVVSTFPIEIPANTTTGNVQRTSIEAQKAVGVDADGDYVVVWTSFGQDGSGDGIFAQVFNFNGTKRGGEIQVNSTAVGEQRYAAVAVDADGDFIVTWTGYGQDGDGSAEGNIYARRFNSVGTPRGSEFIVNATFDGNQRWSSIGVDVDGDFVITWTGEDDDGDGVFAQIFSAAGDRIGTEIEVNQTFIGQQRLSRVALDADGDFVVTWTGDVIVVVPPATPGKRVFARKFNADGSDLIDPITLLPRGEFQVNLLSPTSQTDSSVSLDLAGDFVVAWAADGIDGGGYGIFAQRYNALAQPQGTRIAVNVTTVGAQQTPSVALDHFGDFVVTWQGAGTQPGQEDLSGVFARRFNFDGTPQAPPPVVVGATDEFRVNTTVAGVQQAPSIGLSGRGDVVVAWSGNGIGDAQGVFSRVFSEPFDGDGPIVADVIFGTIQVQPNVTLPGGVRQFKVTFGEEVSNLGGDTGFDSVRNPDNWALFRNGAQIIGGVSSIAFEKDPATQKYTATLQLDGNGLSDGTPALFDGSYVLRANSFIRDLAGIFLDGNQDGTAGDNFDRPFQVASGGGGGGPGPAGDEFIVNTERLLRQENSDTSSDNAGNFVVVWQSLGQDDDLPTDLNVYGQLFTAAGTRVGAEFRVNRTPATGGLDFETGSQFEPQVAMSDTGEFVVVWSGRGQGIGQDITGIYGQRYNRFGATVGGTFLVNTTTNNLQNGPAVAMDTNGDFVVSWTSYAEGDQGEVVAQRFSNVGNKLGGEIKVNSVTANRQQRSRVAMSDSGDFVVTFESYNQDGADWGVFAQRYRSDGLALGGNFQVNSFTNDEQLDSSVAVDADGDFVIAWSSFGQDGSGYGVFARRYNAAGVAQGSEFRVNAVTLNWQRFPDVAVDKAGNFIVTWTTFDMDGNQDGEQDGIYARAYRANGSDAVDPVAGVPVGEFRVNRFTVGNQQQSAIAMDADGDFVISWTTLDDDPLTDPPIVEDTGIAARRFFSFTPSPTTSGPAVSTAGLYSPGASRFYLRNSHSGGPADINFSFGPAGGGATPITGDFNGDGIDTIGLYFESTGVFVLKNSNTDGIAENTIFFGPGGQGFRPVVGDWDGDGVDSIGIFQPTTSVFFLRNNNSTGTADLMFSYGPGGAGWTPLAGDWDGDGDSTIGLYNPTNGFFFLRNSTTAGPADHTFAFGPGGSNFLPIVGDFNGDGTDTVGLYAKPGSVFFLRNDHAAGGADITYAYGPAGMGWLPLAGDWNGPSGSPLRFAGRSVRPANGTTNLTDEQLDLIADAARARWAAAGLDGAALAALDAVEFKVANLQGNLLGVAGDGVIYIDANAAGRGWFVDSTPLVDEEFVAKKRRMKAIDSTLAGDGVDLLSAVSHELGHILGLDDVHHGGNLMAEVLGRGVRRTPSENAVDQVIGSIGEWL